ncbi:hypothetical protein [Rhizobium tubonense]|nr:hypothetical protein [Rhizobium tubonense]
MAGKLTMRVVRDDQARRLSVYLRPDATYEYVEERLSEWDDAPASWAGQQASGIFPSAKDAMAEAKQVIGWMRHPSSEQCNRYADVGAPSRNWRGIGVAEHALLMHLLRREFKGRAEILEQMKSVEVMRISPEGSLMLRSRGPLAVVEDNDSPSSRPNDHIPVEGFYDDVIDDRKGIIRIASLVRLAIHVTDGRLSELEIYKENGTPILIDPYEADLSRVHFY